ncbi:1,4-alpha-glucan-branching enzyme [Centipeda periodontii DSM 2778]|uniref:1,4-alpha-glucan branching enzyme GlgB n=1 Tax=Centipeda periodontii DSM 2778 TaxID=888060 RepID=F5RPS0_9FIRM|nr:1,4-alpha-glucan branching protein GlgB [Centipeda periodontii]EGK57571.1 1,4-alpha-glucan-branching enzyme [Centipeda periodontii DSM 2778]
MKTSTLSEFDLYLFHQGTNYHAQEMLGAHFVEQDGKKGIRFTVWAPNANAVSVVGEFNDWNVFINPMNRIDDGEIWETFVEGLGEGEIYKYAIEPQWGGPRIMKADPYGFYAEKKPQTASRTYDMNHYVWGDQAWQKRKEEESSYERPMLTYEVHAGSWRRTLEGEYLSYRDLADQLIGYVKDMNYTHIEFMPLCEHPYDGSWGYQATGYFAVTSRYGTPDDFRYLVDTAHQNGIGIIMDWVPGHFCKDEQGLRHFDGKNLYESDNEMRAENWEWGTTNFDYGRTEVQSFLISNALFWFEEFHIDGLRIDAVANMLYLNYGRKDGEWQPNKYGDTGNLEAMDFLKKLNETIFKYHPNALMIAEESTAWPLISKPVYMGGMGFNYKWNMGWMNDMLSYMSLDPIYRKWNQDKITFSLMYAFSENFVLPLSHDEVVHGKCSLISKMPGDYWQKFAGLRGFFGYWIAHPGKKLLFMGGEFGHFIEWNFDDSMDWHLVEQYPMHTKMLAYSKALNKFYVDNKAFWQVDFDWNGFQWIDCNDNENSIISLIRRAEDRSDFIVCVHNFTPEVRHGYRIGVPTKGTYVEVFNSDEEAYGGSGVLNTGDIVSEDYAFHGREQSIVITVPPLASTFYRLKRQSGAGTPDHEIPETVDAVAKKKAVTPKTGAAAAKASEADTVTEKPAPKKRTTTKTADKEAAKTETKKKSAGPRAAAKKDESSAAPVKRTAAKKTTKAAAKETEAEKPAKKAAPKKTAKTKSAEELTEAAAAAPKKRTATMTATKKSPARKKAAEGEEKPKKTRAAKS